MTNKEERMSETEERVYEVRVKLTREEAERVATSRPLGSFQWEQSAAASLRRAVREPAITIIGSNQ